VFQNLEEVVGQQISNLRLRLETEVNMHMQADVGLGSDHEQIEHLIESSLQNKLTKHLQRGEFRDEIIKHEREQRQTENRSCWEPRRADEPNF